MDLIGFINEGYKIIRQGKLAVMGECDGKYSAKYVAWNYKLENPKPVFYYGHYGNNLEKVEDAFNLKESAESSND